MQARRVLVVGGGGREHALASRLLDSVSVGEVIVAPGNAGTARAPLGSNKTLRNAAGDPLDIARSERVDLVVVGPEAPLCDGLVDRLTAEGILAYGPGRAAAALEGSKEFMKDFAARHGIRTARHVVVHDMDEARRALDSFDTPPVVKADGLCAGKGVVVSSTRDEALAALSRMLEGGAFGDAGKTVVLEERIVGQEASVHAICDGERAIVLPAAQDHKRIGDGDTGPNTGGMGSYAPAPLVTPALARRIEEDVIQRAVEGMKADGMPYRGTLFAGLMITARGEAVLLEFNVRFGDPETQVLMNVVEGDLAEALGAAARGQLERDMLRVRRDHALCVVLAASGYPGKPRKGDVIEGLPRAEGLPGVSVYHAGTRREDGRILTHGGRVLGVTARGATLTEAHGRAYRAAEQIHFAGRQMRLDIGARALGGG
jgi:phosphoribosylamine--glycine ligase